MLYFLISKSAGYTVEGFLGRRGKSLTDVIVPLFYDDLYKRQALRPGTAIFTDMDRVKLSGHKYLESLYDHLSKYAPDLRVINHPTKFLARYELLKTLYEQGINNYQIKKASDDLSDLTFPVYLRSARGHNLILSGLLNNPSELEQAIREKRVWGNALQEIYVIEFCDTSDENGVFTKYAAFRIPAGPDGRPAQIVPRHINFDKHWVVKSSGHLLDHDLHMQMRDQFISYHETNPHRDWLERICKIANLEYGRLDYGILNGKPQLWEINTNPSFGPVRVKDGNTPFRAIKEPYYQAFYHTFLPALRQLAEEPPKAQSIPLDEMSKELVQLKNHLTANQNLIWKIAYSKKWWVRGPRKISLKLFSVFVRILATARLIK